MPTHPTHSSWPTRTRPNRAPRLALVLGSGGERSVAALGVADALAREGAQPDLVVGCGAGALFGAIIALRMPAEQALQTAAELWSPALTRRWRWRAWPQLLAPRWTGFDRDFALRDDRAIERRIRDVFGQRRIEDAPTALRVAATDAASGEAVVVSQGGMADALRASIAVPVLFPAVTIDGRRLVGGVVSDPLPLGAAADARMAIALGFPGMPAPSIDTPSRLMVHVSTALINNLMQARNAAARAAGQRVLHLEIPSQRRTGQPSALRELFEAGRRAATAQLPQIITMLEGRAMRAVA